MEKFTEFDFVTLISVLPKVWESSKIWGMKRLIALLLCAMLSQGLFGKLVQWEVSYKVSENDTEALKGYVVWDDAISGPRPGILVVHEWWGHNDYARMRAEMLAKLGYVALAVDMYGEGKLADHPENAKKFMMSVVSNRELMEARFLAALKTLKEHPYVDSLNVGAIGYCFGGGVVLNMARLNADVKGVVSFHGSVASNIKASAGIKPEILVLNGEDDPFITKEQVADFKQEMEDAGANYKFINYPGAVHGFTSKEADENGKKFGLPLAYDPKADQESWEEMKKFFSSLF